MEDISQETENSSGCNDLSNVMEVTNPPSFVLHNTNEIVAESADINVEEWFKPKSESVAIVDSIKTEEMDSNYLDALGYHFLSPKDSVDMCIVTNICDMGLGLDGNTNEKNKLGSLLSLSDKEPASRVSSDMEEQNSFLEDLDAGEISDKEILVAVDSSDVGDSDKFNLIRYCNNSVSVNYILEPNNDEPCLPDDNSVSSGLREDGSFCEDEETGVKKALESSEDCKEKISCERFIISRPNGTFDTEKDVDFPEFNFLTFQVDPNDGINSLPQMDYCDNELSDSCNITENPLLPESDSISECALMSEPCNIDDVPDMSDTALGARWFRLSDDSVISDQYSSPEASVEQGDCCSSESVPNNSCISSDDTFVPEESNSSETLMPDQSSSETSLVSDHLHSPEALLIDHSIQEASLISGHGSSEVSILSESSMVSTRPSSEETHLLSTPCNSSDVCVQEQTGMSEIAHVHEQCDSTKLPSLSEQCSGTEVSVMSEQCNSLNVQLTSSHCSPSNVPLSIKQIVVSENPLVTAEPCITSEGEVLSEQLGSSEMYRIPAGSRVFIADNSSLLQAYNVLIDEKDLVNANVSVSLPKQKIVHSKYSLLPSGIDGLQNLMVSEKHSGSSINQRPAIQYVSKLKQPLNVRPTNPRSVLKPPLRNINQTKNIISSKHPAQSSSLKKTLDTFSALTNVSPGQENSKNSKRKPAPPSMAIIAISTNKAKNTTEIVINTSLGEQKFKGKTSDLMKATSNIWNKIDNSLLKAKVGQTLNIDNVEESTTSMSMGIDGLSEVPQSWVQNTTLKNDAVEQPITEALLELGIDVYSLKFEIDSKGQKLYTCPYEDCYKAFSRMSMLKVHILTHYGVRPYKCDYDGCHWTFYTYFKLKRHRETHLKRKLFICPVDNCGRRFTTIYNLNSHQKLHERPAEMVCPVETCRACFQTKRSMELHMKKHDSQHAPYKCSYEGCGKHYYSANSLNCHIRSHQHKEEEVRCQWEGCGKLFDKPCRLKAHMRTHTGDKPYPCTYQDCGWAFSSASKLKRHQHKHTNERRFRCSYDGCNKSFMRSEHLKEHALTHVGARTFQCTVENCGVKFSAKSSLYVHLKKHNNGQHQLTEERSNWCPVQQCKRKFSNKTALRQHVMLVHTSVEAPVSSQIDYSPLMTGDEDLVMLDDLQLPSDIVPVTGDLLGSDSIAAVLPAPDPQSPYLLHQSDPETSTSVPILEMQLQEDSEDDVTCGSARTSYTYQDIVQYRGRKNDELSTTQTIDSPGLRLPADVVLGTGILGNAPDITNTLLLQDDQSTYPDDSIVSGVGEFQVLLLDPGGNAQQEFAESTINLRDLE